MSSFNYFSPVSNKSISISLNSSISLNRSISTLNPDASTYIPLNASNNKHSESPSLNAGAAPYIPLPPTLNIGEPKSISPKKTPCPSFAYYTNINSSQIYNATYKYIENNNNNIQHHELKEEEEEEEEEEYDDTTSIVSSSIMDTPIPASITSSVFSEQNNIDLIDIEPYVPNKNRTDIDQIDNIIHKEINNQNENIKDIHPVIAALTEEESNELLNAPIWTPDDTNENNMEEKQIIYSKIAIDEEDYQFIIHPNKKPTKYGYKQANIDKIARDESINDYMNTPHIQYMYMNIAKDDYTQPTSNIAGETYDETSNINRELMINNNTHIITHRTEVINNRNIRQSDDLIATNPNPNPNERIISNNNLYSNKASRIAMVPEGECYLETNQSNLYKIAYDTMRYRQIYNESPIAQAHIEKISYIYCKT